MGRFESTNHQTLRVRTKEIFSVTHAKTIKLRDRAVGEGEARVRVNKTSGNLRLIRGRVAELGAKTRVVFYPRGGEL